MNETHFPLQSMIIINELLDETARRRSRIASQGSVQRHPAQRIRR